MKKFKRTLVKKPNAEQGIDSQKSLKLKEELEFTKLHNKQAKIEANAFVEGKRFVKVEEKKWVLK